MLAELPEMLSWTGAPTPYRELTTRLGATMDDRFGALLTHFAKAGVGTRLCTLADELSERGRTRLLSAPETVRRLLHRPPTDLRFFLDSVLAEHRREGRHAGPVEPVWSALGDGRFPGTDDGGAGYRAPLLTGGLPVDHLSPHAAYAGASASGPTLPCRPAELTRVVGKLDSALAVARQVSPQAHALVTAMTRVVVVRKSRADGGWYFSYSDEQAIGRLAFTNIHDDRVDVPDTTGRLVHESLHSLLYLVERDEPIFDRRDAGTVRVASPWTGRALVLRSFTHACYVWFALWMFWRRAQPADLLPSRRIATLCDQARRGFDRPEMAAARKVVAAHLTPHGRALLDLLDDMRHGRYG
ncbi:aKG-HExxH-type peptide beta-hydroxylase [Mangrovihabitans endophyticus]|uniref:HEXXH motif-containing protein n=1 Tax=Mangrovihabitans endophyticus TaxID=1751298 RepID=A0A8J3BX74_9ACTN|nr:HEXXH motif-containing putative peptide modification protein [Mangrovihabitans endophyticus]GGK75243.1 hypothetical protein GCM10012284_06510 [Mangrovihabitans endophyticus]